MSYHTEAVHKIACRYNKKWYKHKASHWKKKKHHSHVACLAPSWRHLGNLIGNLFLALLQNLAHECYADRIVELFACSLNDLILCPVGIVALYLTDSLLLSLRYIYSSIFPLPRYRMWPRYFAHLTRYQLERPVSICILLLEERKQLHVSMWRGNLRYYAPKIAAKEE